MVGELWDSVMLSPWSPELAGLGMPFMPFMLLSECNWVLIIVGSSFGARPSLLLVDWGSHWPPRLVCYCAGAARTKPQNPGSKPTSAKISLPHISNPTINSKWTSIDKSVKRLRLLYERREINYNIKSSNLICTNLFNKKLMLKSYAGKKISLIMEKTTVDFILVTSSIYHCFSFLDLSLVMSDVDPVWC